MEAKEYSFSDTRTSLPIELPVHGSVFVVFRKDASTAKKAEKEAEKSAPITVEGPWKATFANKNFGTPEEVNFENLKSWSDHENDAVKYYSGTVHFTTEIEINESFIQNHKKVYLEIEQVFVLADILINGQKAGTIWTHPYKLEITGMLQPGKNTIEIRATNTWANRLIGDAVKNENYTQMPCFGNYKNTNRCSTFYSAKSVLPKSGVAGSVVIFGVINK
jgi:beta-galactosidase/beta-glucuronidase